ncbi:DUF1993 family protein [Methyloglobulus sp.]|uniref:DUF1993 domain-containing protein n=1 Tax=Methyloglobulus sp. TaxID=2518622 RepID=UPI0032B733C2
MPIDMHQASIPVFVKMLGNLSAILEKGDAHAKAKNIDPTVFINYRLAPDMYPLSKQVQIATDMAKGCAARLAGLEVPSYEDNEATFADLQTRIAKTIAFVQSLTPEQIKGSEDLAITFKIRGIDRDFIGLPYLLNFVLPNLYFHITTTYAILRHNGVELGKLDYLGGF